MTFLLSLGAAHAAARCSYSFGSCSSLSRLPLRGRPRRALLVRAQEGEQQQQQQVQEADRESLLEAIEAQARARKGSKATQIDLQRPAQRASSAQGGKVVWKEGQLFPEGWDEMDLPTKMYQLYMGERGFMFWANKAALASIIFLAAAWVVFRFLGPAVGLYTLQNDFTTPNF